jgi:molecular chaperone GrpE
MSKKKKDQVVEQATEPVESIESTEAAAAEEKTDWKDKYLRALADMENARKRTERDRAEAHKYALEDVLRNILPILDSLHYALKAEGDAADIREGIELAISNAHRILGEHGFMPIEALHKPFDPCEHEAVGMRPDSDHPANTVIEEERVGYRLHDRLLRPSRVHISIKPPPPPDEDGDAGETAGDEATAEES